MRQLIIVFVVGLLGLNLWEPGASYAQLGPGQEREVAEYRVIVTKDLNELKGEVKFFQNMSIASMLLVILVGTMGLASATINNLNFKGSKLSVTILGAVISVITLVSNNLFTEDFRAYGEKASIFSDKVKEIENNMEALSFEFYDDFIFTKGVISDSFKATDEMSGEVNANPLWWIFGPSEAEAGEVLPSWIKTLPVHPRYYMFVAQGEGRRMREAYQNSMANVHRKIDEFLDRKYRGKYRTPESFIDLMRNLRSEIERKSSFRQPTQGGYKYYVLVQLNKRTVMRFAKYYLE